MYTGNTIRAAPKTVIIAVYPCVYREHVHNSRVDCSRVRFIPVYTGNTKIKFEGVSSNAVYPCVYREHGYNHMR